MPEPINKQDAPRPPNFADLDQDEDKREFEDYTKTELGATEATYQGVDCWQDAVVETDVGTFHLDIDYDGKPYVKKRR